MRLDGQTWEAVRVYFEQLLDTDPGQRAARIDSLDLDPRQRIALEALLEAHDDTSSSLLDQSVPELLGLGKQPGSPAADWSGRSLGSWRVEQRFAEGGMSVIYVGFRDDGQFSKKVAIKVLKSSGLVAEPGRLAEEIRILARLEHPGIARLIDSGISETDDPYLVMEFVDGTPIDIHCADHALDVEARVRLVLEVADALEYAHQRQIIHCDIKPANILVRPDQRACIVDFGIAAVVQRQSGDAPRARRFCSPGYSAPERLTGEPPNTTQDVYSLGAVLVRLLTGSSPVPTEPGDATGSSGPQARDPGLTSSLNGDLAAIAGRALANDPARRYPGIGDLKADLNAWLEHRPVIARNGGRGYVLGKWLRRHTLAATMGLLLAITMLAGTAAALHQARLAQAETERVLAARDFLVSIFAAADPAAESGDDPPASELLRRGSERITHELSGQPSLLAELQQVIGHTQLERGLINDAAVSLDHALALFETLTDHPMHARTLSDRGLVAYEQGDYDAAVDWMRRGYERSPGFDQPGSGKALVAIRLADIHVVRDEPDQALALIDEVFQHNPDASVLPYALRVRGSALQMRNEPDAAVESLVRALELQQRLDPDDVFAAKILHDLGIAYWEQRNLDAATDAFQRSYAHKQRVYGDDHPQTISALGNLSVIQIARGRHVDAEATLKKTLESLRTIHAEKAHPDIAYTHGMLAWSQYQRGLLDSANRHIQRGSRDIAALGAGDYPTLGWIEPLRGLIELELEIPGHQGRLGAYTTECHRLDEITEMNRLLCLARALVRTESAPGCEEFTPPEATPETVGSLPIAWRRVLSLVGTRCTDAMPALADSDQGPSNTLGVSTATDELPGWLRKRLMPDSPK